ncbi:unnamed protein product [Strongylus vulgaris]|uniref:RNase H type-1 domain-containing protein n=1 Tax=Strongylus vulgaris TaxID=40348 RepID=A0A3P7JHU5_STRVU|nr:unnamed protein product [Strongylus vulgaris]
MASQGFEIHAKSERIIGPVHNSGLAEILGAQTALRLLRKWRGYKNEPVILRTDFLPLVKAMSEGGSDGRFSEQIEEVRKLATKFPKGVEFQHVYAHDGDPGNEQADALARMATAEARRARSASVSRELFEPDGPRRGRSISRNRAAFRSRKERDRRVCRGNSSNQMDLAEGDQSVEIGQHSDLGVEIATSIGTEIACVHAAIIAIISEVIALS